VKIIHANKTKHHAVCSNHNPALQNLQKDFALQSLHCLQRPRLFSVCSGRYSSGSPVKHIVDSRMLRFRCRSFPVYISYLRLSSCVYYFLFVVLFVFLNTIPPPPGGTAILPEYIHYYGYYYQVIVQCLST
jgi:hypothetical protein